MSGGYLDLERWPRRHHYQLYRSYDQPFFNVCTAVRLSAAHAGGAWPAGRSFFLSTLHASLIAANAVEELRLRLRGDGVWRHERIHAGSTVLRDDDTFGFGYFAYVESYGEFEACGREEIARVRGGRALEPHDERDDLIHYSVLPWIRLTSFTHARRRRADDSVPKVVFGKHFDSEGQRWLPVSVEVHHALVDGLHVGRFLERFEAELASGS